RRELLAHGFPRAAEQHRPEVLAQLPEHLANLRVKLFGQEQAQRSAIAVPYMNANRPALVWPVQLRFRELPLQLRKHVQDVLSSPECVRAKVGARAIRVARLAPAHRD